MEKKQLIKIAKIIIIVMIVIIIVENSIRGIGNFVEDKKEEKKEQKQDEKYKDSTEYKETKSLEGVVADVEELLKSNDIDALYSLLDENYRDYKFQNKKENFEEYIKEYVNNEAEITLQTYKKVNKKFICTLLSKYNENISTFKVMINNPDDKENLSIVFDTITSISKNGKKIDSKGLRYEFVYIVTASGKLTYTIEFTNLSEKDAVNYIVTDILLSDSADNKFKITPQNMSIALAPGESVRYNLQFEGQEVNSFEKDFLTLKYKDANGNEIEENLYVSDLSEIGQEIEEII